MTASPADSTPAPEPAREDGVNRRAFLGVAGGLAATTATSGLIVGCADGAKPGPPRSGRDIRLQSVKTPVDSGLMGRLLPRFERETGYRVHITTAEDVYGPARAG
jgi:hypothetical protein